MVYCTLHLPTTSSWKVRIRTKTVKARNDCKKYSGYGYSILFIQTVHTSKFYFPSFSLIRKLFAFSKKHCSKSVLPCQVFQIHDFFFFFGTESLAKETKVSNAGVLCIVMLRYLGYPLHSIIITIIITVITDWEVAHRRSGSSVYHSWSNCNLEMLVFEERQKTEYPEKTSRREPN